MAENEKLVFMVTHGVDHPEHVTIPFVMAAAALASDVAVVMGFQADAVAVMQAGAAETVNAPGFPPLEKLLGDVRGLGAALLVCSPCLSSRGIAADQLVDGAEIVAAGRFVAEVTSATNVLTY